MRERPVGKVLHAWPKAHAAMLHLDEPLRVGERVRIMGHGHDFVQEVTSLEIDGEPHTHVWAGDLASLAVEHEVHRGDRVFKVEPDDRYPLFELQE